MLFKTGVFTSHSGAELLWKIECDALTDEDWETLAGIVANKWQFSSVEGIPRGGLKFADALHHHMTPDTATHLIVDDVFTTGASMSEALHRVSITGANIDVLGFVVFARGDVSSFPWVKPMWTAAPWVC